MSHPHPLDLLLTAARNGDEAAIIRILKTGQLINEIHPIHHEAVITTVAGENNEKAVTLLIRHGALPRLAVEGAAKGNHNALMTRLATSNPGCEKWAVRGAARSNRKLKLGQSVTGHPAIASALKNWAVYGAAAGDHKVLMDELIAERAAYDFAVRGAAQVDNEVLMDRLIAAGANLTWAVYGAAVGGHEVLMDRLIAAGASQDFAVYGAAAGGHEVLMDRLIAAGASQNLAVEGAAYGGYEVLMNRLIAAGASQDHAVRGATNGENEVLVDRLLSAGASQSGAVTGAIYSGLFLHNREHAMRLLVAITDPACRLAFAAEADRQKHPGTVKLTPLLPLKILKRPMERYGLTEREALAWYRHDATLSLFLLGKFPTAIPNDLRLILARDFLRSQRRGLNLDLAEVFRVQQAMRQAYALAGIVTNLRKKGNSITKIRALESATTLIQRIDALCQHRHFIREPDSLLPKSIRTMMVLFPEYGNLTALKHWIENYAQFLMKHWNPRQRANGKTLITTLETVCNSVDFEPLATSHEAFATFLNSNQSWQTLISVLETTPHWKEIGKLFEMAVPAKPDRVITV